MGLKLSGIPSVPATPEALRGATVAIDAPNLLYAFYAVQLRRAEATPERRELALRAATRGLLQRVRDLEAVGARPLVVFDGPPHALKMDHLVERDRTRSVPAIGAADHPAIVDALRAHGVPHVRAPHDAEAQACAMARRGLVHVVATTDWDALAMGAPRLLRNLSAHPAKTAGRRWSLVDAPGALAHLGTTRERLAAAAVLMGCDYFAGFPRVGPKKALRLVETGDAADALARALATLGASARDAARAHEAYALLVDPPAHDAPLALPRRAPGATTLDRYA